MTSHERRRQRCEVLFDFEGDIDRRELSVSKGEVLVLVKRFAAPRDDWLVAAKPPFGMKGYVPTSYVHIRDYQASDRGIRERCGISFDARAAQPSAVKTSEYKPKPLAATASPSRPSKPLPPPPPPPKAPVRAAAVDSSRTSTSEALIDSESSSSSRGGSSSCRESSAAEVSSSLPSLSSGSSRSLNIHASGLVKDTPTCAACGRCPSTADRIHLFGHTWHKKCCRCDKCNAALGRASFNVHSLSTRSTTIKLYCSACASSVRGAAPVSALTPVAPLETLAQLSSSSTSLAASSPLPSSHTSSPSSPPSSFSPTSSPSPAADFESAAIVRSVSSPTLHAAPTSPPLVVPNKPVPRPPLHRTAITFTSHQRGR